jgi:hypothetical protein
MQSTKRLFAIALLTLASAAIAQDVEPLTPDRARANFGRPITLAPDDGRAFSAPPAGFADPRAGVAAGSIEELSYASERGISHLWNVDESGRDRESWAENLLHFAQRLFR